MFKLRLTNLSVVAIAVAVIVGGCASSQPSTGDVSEASLVPVSAPSQPPPMATPAATVTPHATPTATIAPAPTPTPTPTPTATIAPDPAPVLVAIPKLSKKIAGATKIRYFSIVGETPSELVAQTVEKSAKPCKSKTRDVLACVNWKGGGYRWATRTKLSNGSCTVTSLTIVKPTSIVHLPRWVGPAQVQPALVAWWKPVLDHFAWHEGQHIKILKSYEKKLRPLLVGHKCSSAKSIIRKWERSVDAAQDKFDAKDFSWQPERSVPYTGTET